LRRIAETEAEWFRSEIEQPMLQRGQSPDDVGRFAAEFAPRLGMLSDEAILAIYHRQQRHAWMQNVITGFSIGLERAGLFHRVQATPAMCFLEITGYTQLTAERGDDAAADLAEQMKRVVERVAVAEGGRAVKWLGDGVMFYFASPKSAVEAAISMVAAISDAGMVPAHVGVHAGPVVFREGDYYGHTVNLTARIGDFARPGEVLVSQAVVDEVKADAVVFEEIGPVELRGIGEALVLYSAVRSEI
jgi:adenylate cyclase